MIDDKALEAACDAFEPLSSVLRYRGRRDDGRLNWHACDLMAMRAAITAYLSALTDHSVDANKIVAGDGWQPIETAPKDRLVLVAVRPSLRNERYSSRLPTSLPAYIDEDGSVCDPGSWKIDTGLDGPYWTTTHWRPLPEPPGAEATFSETETVQIGQSGVTDGVEWVVVPKDNAARQFSDSSLPFSMIAAGIDALERAADDEAGYVSGISTDWDFGMKAVAVYRAMLAAAGGER